MGKMLQIRDVPEDVHERLKARAAREGRTLSDMLREELALIAGTPTRAEVIERIRNQESAGLEEMPSATLRRMRDSY